MADDTLITGTTVGDISYVVAYYDVNTGNLYDANGNMYGNSTLTTTLDNEFILELHYVQDISTDSDPTTWAVWNGLEGKTVDSSLAFDSDYKHAYEGASTESTAAASHEIKVTVSSVDKDTLNSEGNLIINPYGLEPEQIPQGSTSTPRMVVPYDSFEYVSSNTSGTVFKFHVADPDGLMYAVPANIQVRVSDPLYLYINPSSIYEVNIPPRYNEGVFKFPMNIMSRKLLKALDYTGVSGVVGTLEHKISVRRDTLTGVSYNSNTYTRDKDKDSTAVYSGDTFLFCAWVNGSSTIWTKGNDVQTNTAVYSISNGTATLLGSTANPVTETDSVLFRTFAFPFLVKNLIDYNATIDIPMQDVDWAKDYIISIIKNNMEEVTGKASTGAYGVVKIANDGTIDVDDGVISIATSLATKQDNMSATAPVAINNSTVSLNFGDGLDVGVTGTTNANKLIVNEASVKEVLEDVVDGGTEPAVNEIVTADNLKGALSVGQAVDVSCPIGMAVNGATYTTIQISGSTEWVALNSDEYKDNYLQDFSIKIGNINNTGTFWFGWSTGSWFPKGADNLVYLLLLDIRYVGSINLNSTGFGAAGNYIIPGVPYSVPESELTAYTSGMTRGFSRVACRFLGSSNNTQTSTGNIAYFTFKSNESGTAIFEIKNWRTYEVTNLTDEAIAYIAQLPDPDAFFRSSQFSDVSSGYMIKSDMVCPWTYLITMPTNSPAMTVASGLAYQLNLTDGAEHEITVDTFPTNAYGQDAHLQLLLSNNSTAVFKSPLNLIDPIVPNAANNITVKFRAGQANVYVDDTDAGYVVSVNAGTESDSLYYGLTGSTETYVVFAKNTDEQDIEMPEVTEISSTKRIVGNGIENTVVDGSLKFLDVGNTSNQLSVTDLTMNGYVIAVGWHPVQASNVLFTTAVWDEWAPGRKALVASQSSLKLSGCTFSNLVFPTDTTSAIITASNGGFIRDCLVIGCTSSYIMNGRCDVSGSTFSSSGDIWSNGFTFADCTFDGVYCNLNIKTVYSDTNKFIGLSHVRGYSSNTGMGLWVVADSTIDLSEFTHPYNIFCYGTNYQYATIAGTTIAVVGNDATTVSGTATVLYNAALDGETGVKSRTISGGGSNYIMRNNGSIGVPVTVASGTASGSLYEKLTDSSILNITFAPVIDGSTIDAFSYGGSGLGLNQDHDYNINGAGWTNTKLSYRFGNSNPNSPNNTTISCMSLTVAQPIGSFYNLVTFENCEVHTGMQLAGRFIIKDCYCHDISAVNILWRQSLGPSADARGAIITGSTFAHVRIANDTYENPNNGLAVSWPLFENTTFTDMNNIAMYRGTASISGCLFDNTGYAKSKFITGADNQLSPGHANITGSTFTNYDISVLNDSSTVTFSGTNLLNSTVSGAGTVVLGGTVSGSSTSHCVIDASTVTWLAGSNVDLSYVDITNRPASINFSVSNTDIKSLKMKNCTCATHAPSGSFPIVVNYGCTASLDNVAFSSAIGNGCYALAGTLIMKNTTLACGAALYAGTLVFRNTVTGYGFYAASNNASGKMVFEPGSIVTLQRIPGIEAMGTMSLIVGTYNDSTGEITQTGTATVILGGGTTVSISGSGTYIDSTGLH